MKTLLHFVEPLGLVWLLLAAFILQRLWRRDYRTIILPAVGWSLLTAVACTPLTSTLLASMEGTYPPVSLDQLATADAIVCLGGGAAPSRSEPTGFHLKNAGDRLTTAFMLAQMQKAPCLVLGGGGYKVNGEWASEADVLCERLQGVVDEKTQLISLGLCGDTHDEAVRTEKLVRANGWQHVLLVTSAYHLPRAVATFQHQGIQVTPVPCNYISSQFRGGDLVLLSPPGAGGFENFRMWLHEILGGILYRWKGWM